VRRRPALLALLLLVSACASAGGADPAGTRILERKAVDTTRGLTPLDAVKGEDGECKHVYEQVGVHPWTRIVDGMPQTELCVIVRCARCGKVLHECQRRR
jgi:hypothetical protein